MPKKKPKSTPEPAPKPPREISYRYIPKPYFSAPQATGFPLTGKSEHTFAKDSWTKVGGSHASNLKPNKQGESPLREVPSQPKRSGSVEKPTKSGTAQPPVEGLLSVSALESKRREAEMNPQIWRDGIFSEMMEIFRGKLDPDVVQMVLSEAGWQAAEAIDKLWVLCDGVTPADYPQLGRGQSHPGSYSRSMSSHGSDVIGPDDDDQFAIRTGQSSADFPLPSSSHRHSSHSADSQVLSSTFPQGTNNDKAIYPEGSGLLSIVPLPTDRELTPTAPYLSYSSTTSSSHDLRQLASDQLGPVLHSNQRGSSRTHQRDAYYGNEDTTGRNLSMVASALSSSGHPYHRSDARSGSHDNSRHVNGRRSAVDSLDRFNDLDSLPQSATSSIDRKYGRGRSDNDDYQNGSTFSGEGGRQGAKGESTASSFSLLPEGDYFLRGNGMKQNITPGSRTPLSRKTSDGNGGEDDCDTLGRRRTRGSPQMTGSTTPKLSNIPGPLSVFTEIGGGGQGLHRDRMEDGLNFGSTDAPKFKRRNSGDRLEVDGRLDSLDRLSIQSNSLNTSPKSSIGDDREFQFGSEHVKGRDGQFPTLSLDSVDFLSSDLGGGSNTEERQGEPLGDRRGSASSYSSLGDASDLNGSGANNRTPRTVFVEGRAIADGILTGPSSVKESYKGTSDEYTLEKPGKMKGSRGNSPMRSRPQTGELAKMSAAVSTTTGRETEAVPPRILEPLSPRLPLRPIHNPLQEVGGAAGKGRLFGGQAVSPQKVWTPGSRMATTFTKPHSPMTGRRPVAQTAAEARIVEVMKVCETESKVLVIMRGMPGSGKSTLARKLVTRCTGGRVLSTDDYFTVEGVYTHDVNKLGEAHEWNQSRACTSMQKGISPVIIDNTNTRAYEMVPYARLALMFLYRIELLEPNTPWKFQPQELVRKTTHSVPFTTITKMVNRFDRSVNVDTLMRHIGAKEVSELKAAASSQPAQDSTKPVSAVESHHRQSASKGHNEPFSKVREPSEQPITAQVAAVVHRSGDGGTVPPTKDDGYGETCPSSVDKLINNSHGTSSNPAAADGEERVRGASGEDSPRKTKRLGHRKSIAAKLRSKTLERNTMPSDERRDKWMMDKDMGELTTGDGTVTMTPMADETIVLSDDELVVLSDDDAKKQRNPAVDAAPVTMEMAGSGAANVRQNDGGDAGSAGGLSGTSHSPMELDDRSDQLNVTAIESLGSSGKKTKPRRKNRGAGSPPPFLSSALKDKMLGASWAVPSNHSNHSEQDRDNLDLQTDLTLTQGSSGLAHRDSTPERDAHSAGAGFIGKTIKSLSNSSTQTQYVEISLARAVGAGVEMATEVGQAGCAIIQARHVDHILELSAPAEAALARLRRPGTVDAGVMVTEEELDTYVEKEAINTEGTTLQGMKELFPHITDEHLKDTLDLCQGDVSWATNILLDSSYDRTIAPATADTATTSSTATAGQSDKDLGGALGDAVLMETANDSVVVPASVGDERRRQLNVDGSVTVTLEGDGASPVVNEPQGDSMESSCLLSDEGERLNSSNATDSRLSSVDVSHTDSVDKIVHSSMRKSPGENTSAYGRLRDDVMDSKKRAASSSPGGPRKGKRTSKVSSLATRKKVSLTALSGVMNSSHVSIGGVPHARPFGRTISYDLPSSSSAVSSLVERRYGSGVTPDSETGDDNVVLTLGAELVRELHMEFGLLSELSSGKGAETAEDVSEPARRVSMPKWLARRLYKYVKASEGELQIRGKPAGNSKHSAARVTDKLGRARCRGAAHRPRVTFKVSESDNEVDDGRRGERGSDAGTSSSDGVSGVGAGKSRPNVATGTEDVRMDEPAVTYSDTSAIAEQVMRDEEYARKLQQADVPFRELGRHNVRTLDAAPPRGQDSLQFPELGRCSSGALEAAQSRGQGSLQFPDIGRGGMGTLEESTSKGQDSLQQDEDLARHLQQNDARMDVLSREIPGAATAASRGQQQPMQLPVLGSMQEVMDEEMARALTAEELKAAEPDTLAIRLNRKQLMEKYPSLRGDLISNVFDMFNHNVKETEFFIEKNYIQGPPATSVIADPTSVVTPSSVMTPGAAPYTVAGPSGLVVKGDRDRLAPSARPAAATAGDEEDQWEDITDDASDGFQNVNAPAYADMRAEAELFRREKKKFMEKAQAARQNGQLSVSSYFSEEARKLGEKVEEANRRAATELFRKLNTGYSATGTLDLHGLHVKEAIEVLGHVVAERRRECYTNPHGVSRELGIITGRGKHSKGGVSRLRPAVLQWIQQQRLAILEMQHGYVKVTV